METSHIRLRRDHKEDEVGPTESAFYNRFRPRLLRRCVNDVFEGTDTTPPCLGERKRLIITSDERDVLRKGVIAEAQAFHHCFCGLHHVTDSCRFNLLLLQQNKTVLDECFDREVDKLNTPFYHQQQGTNFTCELRGTHRVKCTMIQDPNLVKPRKTRFQYVLNCLSESLKLMYCPATTAVSPALTSTPTGEAAPLDGNLIIFVMALVISLLLGVLGTWLGIFCWRKKRKRSRPLPPLMPRPEHASLPNLYDEDYSEDHIYDVVKLEESPTSQPVPDLLSRVPSLPPMTNRTSKSRVHMEPDKSKKAYDKQETYEPLLRDHSVSPDRHSTEPKTPVPADDTPGNDYLPLLPDRTSGEISPTAAVKRVHPYDSVNESEVGIEAQDESITTPKIIDSPSNNPKEPSRNEYFILEPQPSSLKADNGADNKSEDVTPEKNSNPGKNSEKISPNYSGFSGSPTVGDDDLNGDAYNDFDLKKDEEYDRDSDGYEIPVPEETNFDIASSFVKDGPCVSSEDKDALRV